MHSTLHVILSNTADRFTEKRAKLSYSKLEQQASRVSSGFYAAMQHPKEGDIAIITEIKLASPTHPDLGKREDVLQRAKQYLDAKADAVSIITEPSIFHGDVAFVPQVKKHTGLPVIQKDFVIDAYQVLEAAKTGSDALLLMAKITTEKDLITFVDLALEYGIEPVVEINDDYDLEKALTTNTRIIAVNARDLSTLHVDVSRACEFLQKIPDTYLKLGFSGINTSKEVRQYKEAGAAGVLIGTNLMKAENIKQFIAELRS